MPARSSIVSRTKQDSSEIPISIPPCSAATASATPATLRGLGSPALISKARRESSTKKVITSSGSFVGVGSVIPAHCTRCKKLSSEPHLTQVVFSKSPASKYLNLVAHETLQSTPCSAPSKRRPDHMTCEPQPNIYPQRGRGPPA